MKKFTFLVMLMISSLAFSQDPATGPANPIARNAVDVKSIYNGIAAPVAPQYTNEPGGTFDSFGGSTIVGDVTLGDGNTVVKYTNHLYSGIQAGAGNLDVSTMEKLHIDVYSPGFTAFRIKLEAVNGSNVELDVPGAHTQGAWNSYDLDLSTYAAVDLAHLKWIVPVTYTPPGETLYIDNVYFWKNPTAAGADATLSDLKVDGTTVAGFGSGVISYTVDLPNGTTIIPQITAANTTDALATRVITQATVLPGSATVLVTSQNTLVTKTYTVNFVVSGPATAAPTPPNRPVADVKSIFSDAYTQISPIAYTGGDDNTYNTSWCPGNTTLVQVAGNNTNKTTGLGCEGVAFLAGRFDATSFTYFHMDIYTDTATLNKSFNVKFSNWNGGASEANAIEFSVTNANFLTNPNPGTWISLDIPLSSFSAIVNANRNDLTQFVISSDLGTVYYDNLYLHKNTVLSTDSFSFSNIKLYPNPASNVLNIESLGTIQNVSVCNILGQEVLNQDVNSATFNLNVSSLNSGIYVIKTMIDGNLSSTKFIKE
jgi:hypothetical protein